ncbi:MAG TPA: universal stress protein [Thermoleophilaceae bacterium]|nr:universal stress protein [Thermoleophilaceae bacterium]
MDAERLLLIAYDGSDLSKAAVRRAAELFPGAAVSVATVWEPGLVAMASLGMSADPVTGITALPDLETVSAVERAEEDHAVRVAEEGAELARSLGLNAQPDAVSDETQIAEALLDLAERKGAAALVVGTHGITGLRSHLVGSVSRRLLQHAQIPVLVVREGPSHSD